MHTCIRDGVEVNTNLTDARRLSLCPSVTGVISVKSAPFLVQYQVEQAVIASLTLPRIPGESDQDFAERALEDSKNGVRKAGEFGTKVHHGIETGEWVDEVSPWKRHWDDWADKMEYVPVKKEQRLVHPSGFAGTVDSYGRMPGSKFGDDRAVVNVLLDYKTQKMKRQKKGWKATLYTKYAYQLTAYKQMLLEAGSPVDYAVSVLINSVEPTPIKHKVWDDIDSYWNPFLCLWTVWKFDNKYDPVKDREL